MRLVLATFGSHGDLNPYLAIARALRARGHDAVLATHAHYRPLAEAAGVPLVPVRPDYDAAWGARVMAPYRGSERLLRELIPPTVRESYVDLLAAVRGADALLSHPVTFAAPLVAARTGIPWASAVLAPLSFYSLGDEMPLLLLELDGMRRRTPGLYRAFLRAGKRVIRHWMRDVDVLRAELGLPPGGHPVFEGQHAPARVLALFSPVLGTPQPDWPPNVRVTGAVVDDGVHDAVFRDAAREAAHDAMRGTDAPSRALPPALARFLDEGPPPVVVTLGTSAVLSDDAAGVYRAAADAATAIGRRAVLLTGADPSNVPRGLPPTVLAVAGASHAALFPRAAAVVHQGGIGTLTQALRAGRPMLVVPFAHDQPDNADRAARLGVARVLAPRRWRADRVAAALDALLGDPAVAERAAAVGARVGAEDGAAVAAEELLAVARAGR